MISRMIKRLQKSDIPRPVLILVLGGFIQSTGNSLMWPLNSLFMYNVLGRSLTEAGMLMSAQALITLIGQFVSGFLADRFGPLKIMHLGLIIAILSLGAIGVFPVWEVYAPGLICFGLAIAFIFVPINALIPMLWPQGGRRGFNLLYVFNNAGVAVGTALGGFVANYSFRLVFLLNALTFVIFFIFILAGLPGKECVNTDRNISTIDTLKINSSPQRFRPTLSHNSSFFLLLPLCVGILMVWAAYIQLTTVLPVIMTELGFSLPQYSILWTLNGIFIVTLQPIINWIVTRWAHSFTRQFYLSSLLIGGAFLILLAELPYYSYMLAMLILTLGEMLIFPAVPAAAAQIAPERKTATYQGIAAGAASGGRVLGPLFGGFVFDYWGSQSTWILALGFLVIAFFAFFLYQRAEHIYRPLPE